MFSFSLICGHLFEVCSFKDGGCRMSYVEDWDEVCEHRRHAPKMVPGVSEYIRMWCCGRA